MRSFLVFIPSSVTHLILPSYYDLPLPPDALPSSIVFSVTGGHLDSNPLLVGSIPSSVRQLIFGHYFEGPLEAGLIPTSVTELTFGYCFERL